MSDQSSNLTTIRSSRHWAETYISTPAETVIFSRAVNMASITFPVTAITYDNPYSGTGAFGDVLEDMEIRVMVGNTSVERGRLRVAPGAATSTVIQVNEFSRGRINIQDNDRFDVLRSWRLRDRLVGATSSFPKDSRVAESTQVENPQPISTSGGHWVGFVDDGQTYATVAFTGSNSLALDPDGGTLTHLWSVGDGTITVGTSTSASPTATFPVGERWVSHRVSHSNGTSDTQYIWVKVYSRTANLPTDCLIEEMSGSEQDGWRVRFTVPAGWTQTQAPDGALIVIWERGYYGDTVASYGASSSGRSHLKFLGYLVGDSVKLSADEKTVSFEAVSPLALLAQLPGFSQVVNNRATATNWRAIKSLTTNRMIVYLLRWHTTLLRLHDLVLNANSFSYPAFYIQEQTPDAQVREIVGGSSGAGGVSGMLLCDRTGMVGTYKDLLVASTSERTAATTTLTLTEDDVTEVDIDRNHRWQYNTVEGRGFISASTNAGAKPLLSLAPGIAPGEAPTKTAYEKLILATSATAQTDLNERTGRALAKLNSTYNGLPVCSGTITLRGGYDVFDFYGEWVKLTIPASYNKRGIAFSGTRFVIKSISVDYDPENLTKTVRLSVQEETDGVAGVTKAVPKPEKSNTPDYTLPTFEWPYFPPLTPVGLNNGVGTIAAIRSTNTGGAFVTSDFNVFAPVWTAQGFGTLAGNPCGFVVDPFSPKYTTGTGFVNGWLVTTQRIYRITDIFGSPIATSQHTFATAVSNTAVRRIHTGRFVQNHVAVASYYGSAGGTSVAYTTDGTNWTEVNITTHYNTDATTIVFNGTTISPTIWVSEHIAGYVYAGAFTATGDDQAATAELYRSTNYGATWSQVSGMSTQQWTGVHLHFPFHDNPSDTLWYWSDVTAQRTCVLKRHNKNGTNTAIDPITGSNSAGGIVASCGINRQRLVLSTRGDYNTVTNHIGIFTSIDAGDHWTEIVTPINTIGDRYTIPFFNDSTQDTYYAVGEDGRVALGNLSARTFEERGTTTTDDIISIVGN